MSIPPDVAATIVDPKAYADGRRIDEAFTWLRREAPLAQAHIEGFDPFWVVTRHADIQAIERQNDLFHNGDRSTTLTTIEGDRKVREMTGGIAASGALPGADGQPRPLRLPAPDPGLVPAAEPALAGGAHPRDRPRGAWTTWRPWAAAATSPATSPSSIRCG